MEDFGAGTHGTTWGKLPVNPSNANRGTAFEAVSIILLSVAALVLAFRCAHHVRLRQENAIAKLDQILRTYVHQAYTAGRPRSGSRRVVRSCHLGTLVAFC